jgi:ABC-2 type transport system permease protein
VIHTIWLVAKREYLAHVRTKGFVVGILFTPTLIAGYWGISKIVERLSSRESKPFAVVDLSMATADPDGRFGDALPGRDLGARFEARWSPDERWPLEKVVRLDPSTESADSIVEALSARARDGELEGFAVLRGNLVSDDGRMQWYTRNIANDELKERVASTLREIIRQDRFQWYGVTEAQLTAIRAPVLEPRDVDVSGRSRGDRGAREASQFIPMIFVYALLIAISSQAQTLLTSTIDEKSNRIAEVLLSSISPFEMMAGKIIGVLGSIFTLMSVWTAGAAYLVTTRGWQHLVPGEVFAWFLGYMLLAILLYSTLIAAIGSAVTELEEAQSLMLPIWVVLMIPLFLMYFVSKDPDALWVRVVTYIPLVTPFLMVNRLASAVPPGAIEIATSMLLILVSIVGALWLAGRIFRTAILLYGKAATPRELWRWLRTG